MAGREKAKGFAGTENKQPVEGSRSGRLIDSSGRGGEQLAVNEVKAEPLPDFDKWLDHDEDVLELAAKTRNPEYRDEIISKLSSLAATSLDLETIDRVIDCYMAIAPYASSNKEEIKHIVDEMGRAFKAVHISAGPYFERTLMALGLPSFENMRNALGLPAPKKLDDDERDEIIKQWAGEKIRRRILTEPAVVKQFDRFNGGALLAVPGSVEETVSVDANMLRRFGFRELELGQRLSIHREGRHEVTEIWPYPLREGQDAPHRSSQEEAELNFAAGQDQTRSLDKSGILPGSETQGRAVGETPTAEEVDDERDAISNEEILALLSKRGVSSELRRQLAAQLVAGNRPRPLWDDREDYEELSHLNAPRFLKAVYLDLFDAEGNLSNEEVVRLRDPSLVQVVQTYINDRQNAGKGPGDAKGISFSRKDNRGRPRMAKRRLRNRNPSPS